MIYLQNSKESQDLRIPRSLPTPANVTLFFVVMNTITMATMGIDRERTTPKIGIKSEVSNIVVISLEFRV